MLQRKGIDKYKFDAIYLVYIKAIEIALEYVDCQGRAIYRTARLAENLTGCQVEAIIFDLPSKLSRIKGNHGSSIDTGGAA